METKYSKVFAKKLLALFLSVLMALTCFTGALNAFAASKDSDKDYYDDNLAANFMAWAETTDEQTAEALLNYADKHLPDLATSLLGSTHVYFSVNAVVATITIDGYLDSVDGAFDLVKQAQDILGKFGNVVGGDVKNLDLTPISSLTPASSGKYVTSDCGKSYRQNYSAKELVVALAKVLYVNSNDLAGKNILGQFVKGKFNLGNLLQNLILKKDVYALLQDTLDMWSGYQYNLVYNIVANVMIKNTDWFTDEEKTAYYADLKATNASGRTYAWNYDDVLFKALSKSLLQKISVLVTYNTYYTNDKGETIPESSYTRYKDKKIQDSKLVYSDEFMDKENNKMNVYLFQYDFNGDGKIEDMNSDGQEEKLSIAKNDTLYSFAFRALKLAWYTVLKDTLGTVHVNDDNVKTDNADFKNFDNLFFYWKQKSENGGWNYTDWTSNYSAANVKAWAESAYAGYKYSSADAFLADVKANLSYDRNVVDNAKGNWRDVDSTKLFAKLRYSPLADKYFNMQTGPINLYFTQTGTADIDSFFETAFSKYNNMVSGFNDALVAVTKTIFINSDNIGYGSKDNKPVTNLEVPTMGETGPTDSISTISTTLVANTMNMVEYVANATDPNLLNGFYKKNNLTMKTSGVSIKEPGNLNESNFEDAMLPLLISCLQNINMLDPVHDEVWDSCKDAEGVAVVALEEYLSFVLPDKDYSVLYTYDSNGYIVAKNNGSLFDSAVLPMARDALSYVIQSIVPCLYKDSNNNWKEWDVYTAPVTSEADLLDILNSVVCYYASQDTFKDCGYKAGKKADSYGKAVASLLGVVNADGSCQVTLNNTIWQNLDAVVNKLLPIVGTLQYGDTSKAGQASTKSLIWDELVNGILDIADTHASGKQGITNLIERILTVVTAPPISEKGVDKMVYDDFLVPFANALFGGRYSGQHYDKVIPYSSWYDKDAYADTKSDSPFDSLVTTSTLGYYSASNDTADGKETGVLGILINNIFEIFGGTDTYSYTKHVGAKGAWTGAMFAVEAVNNFLPSFVPSISDHNLSAATAVVKNASLSGLTGGSSFGTNSLNITNNASGLNRFYRDANGDVHQSDRYFMYIDSIDIASTNGSSSNLTLGDYEKVVSPDETLRVSLTGAAPKGNALYTFKVNYSIFKGKTSGSTKPSITPENTYATKLTATAYLYMTEDKAWQQTVYNNSGEFNTAYQGSGANQSNDYTFTSASGGTGNNLYATFPKAFIIPKSELKGSKNFTKNVIRVTNKSGRSTALGVIGGNTYSFDGMYTYLSSGTKYYAVTDGKIADTLTTASAANDKVAYVAVDKSTGNILNYNLYDYSTDNGKSWNRGEKQATGVYGGYTSEEVNALPEKDNDGFTTRAHVAWTMDEFLASGYAFGVQREEAAPDAQGNKTYVYNSVMINLEGNAEKEVSWTSTNDGNTYNSSVATLLLQGKADCNGKLSISFGTPIAGLYFATSKTAITKQSSANVQFLAYDGSTDMDVQDFDMPVFVYTTNNPNLRGTVHMYVADDSVSTTLNTQYNAALKASATYASNDFTDADSNGDSATYNAFQNALSDSVKLISTPITTANATTLGNKTQVVPKTTETTSNLNKDVAYEPVSKDTALPAALQADATKGSDFWYIDKACTIPIYSATELTGSNLTQDAAGYSVAKSDEDNKYHYVNAPTSETAWDTTTYVDSTLNETYPYLYETGVQKKDSNGKALYKEVSFVYRDKDGKKCTSKDAWAYKFAETVTESVPNDAATATDNRGIYQKALDNITYNMIQLKSKVNTAIASRIDGNKDSDGKYIDVVQSRKGLNSVNFNVASYEKMVQIAKNAESLIYYVDKVDAQGNKVIAKDENGKEITDAAGNPVYEQEPKTEHSSLEIKAALDMYNEYKGYVQSRGYKGAKLEQEITCATTKNYDHAQNKNLVDSDILTKDDFTVSITRDDTTGAITTATVTNKTSKGAKYGKYVGGVLANEGDVVYSDASWTNYVNALAEAIEVAQEGTANISKIYTIKCNLANAENALTAKSADPGPSDTITVSGKVTIATNLDGTAGDKGIVGINVATADKSIVATTASDGTFTIEVPAGTTELVVYGDTTVDRTVTLSGTASVSDVVIPINICDYVKNGSIDAYDNSKFVAALNNGEYGIYYDLVPNGELDAHDNSQFLAFLNKDIVYAPLALDK